MNKSALFLLGFIGATVSFFLIYTTFKHKRAEPVNKDSDSTVAHRFSIFFFGDQTKNVKFEGEAFEPGRVQQIIELVNEGGSALTIDTLDYNEYERIEKGHFPEHVVSRFHDVVDELDRNLKEFLTDSEKFEVTSKFWEQPTEILLEELATELAFEEEKFEEAKKQKSVIVPFCPKHKFVIACKRFMMRLFSESGECSWLDIFSFMESERFRALKQIHSISTLQSESLDEAVLAAIYIDHAANQPANASVAKKRVLIQGADPIGMYAAFQLFMAGMPVTIVNEQPERYARNRLIFVDPKWMAHLRFFLGTKFDNFFIGTKSLGYINPGDLQIVFGPSLEQVLKVRLVELISYIEHVTEGDGNSIGEKSMLELLYETSLDDVSLPNRTENSFTASLLTATSSTKNLVSEKNAQSKQMIKAKYNQVSASFNANPELLKREKLGKNSSVDVDFLIFSGEKNHRICEKFLGEHQALSNYEPTVTVSLTKGQHISGKQIFPRQITLLDHTPMAEIEQFLSARKFNEILNAAKFLSLEFRNKYGKNFSKLIGTEAPNVVVRIFENKKTINIASMPLPKTLQMFFEKLDEEMRMKKSKNKIQKYKDFRTRLLRVWSMVFLDYAIKTRVPDLAGTIEPNMNDDGSVGSVDEAKLNLDPETVNSSMLPSKLTSVKNVITRLELKYDDGQEQPTTINGKTEQQNAKEELLKPQLKQQSGNQETQISSLIVAAIGDANMAFSPMASSATTGRMAVEYIANALRDYHQGKLTEQMMLETLKKQLNSLKGRAANFVRCFVPLLQMQLQHIKVQKQITAATAG